MPDTLECRHCPRTLIEATAIYLDSNNKKTKEPTCRECYERSIANHPLSGGERDGRQKWPGYNQRMYEGRFTE